MALFGMTAKEWWYASPNKKGCINAVLINDGISQSDRLQKLNKIAIGQMLILRSRQGESG